MEVLDTNYSSSWFKSHQRWHTLFLSVIKKIISQESWTAALEFWPDEFRFSRQPRFLTPLAGLYTHFEGTTWTQSALSIVIWDGALWFWSVIKTIMTDCSIWDKPTIIVMRAYTHIYIYTKISFHWKKQWYIYSIAQVNLKHVQTWIQA